MSSGLTDRRVVNTRATHQAEPLNRLLRAQGALPLQYPCIAISPPVESNPLDSALQDLAGDEFDWLVLTSTNSAIALAQRLAALGLTLAGTSFRCAAVGPATAEAARQQLGLASVALPEQFIAESLADTLAMEEGERVLLPQSAIARPTLARLLADRGLDVTVVEAYRTTCGSGGDEIPRLLRERQVNAITFTSSSTVGCFLERLAAEAGNPDSLQNVTIGCIGPKTAETAVACGLHVSVLPAQNTLGALVNALAHHFTRMSTSRMESP